MIDCEVFAINFVLHQFVLWYSSNVQRIHVVKQPNVQVQKPPVQIPPKIPISKPKWNPISKDFYDHEENHAETNHTTVIDPQPSTHQDNAADQILECLNETENTDPYTPVKNWLQNQQSRAQASLNSDKNILETYVTPPVLPRQTENQPETQDQTDASAPNYEKPTRKAKQSAIQKLSTRKNLDVTI